MILSSTFSTSSASAVAAFVPSIPLQPFISSSTSTHCNLRPHFRRCFLNSDNTKPPSVRPSHITYTPTITCVAHSSRTQLVTSDDSNNNEVGNTHSNNSATSTEHDEGRDYPLGAPSQPARLHPRFFFTGLKADVRRRIPLYLSDWRDGLRFKSIPVVLFLYFASLAPVVAFGGLTSALTGASMGVIEFLISSGAAGMFYAIFSGQPLTFIAPTGLTLAFTSALFTFCRVNALPFLPTYAWVGLWTSLLLLISSIVNLSDIIKYCTRFTDDVFNSLIATNFVYEASRSLLTPFFIFGPDKTNPFVALSLALGTFFTGQLLTALRSSRYLVKRARDLLSDFGPVISIAVMSALAALPIFAPLGLDRLSIPTNFSLAGGRALLVPLLAVPLSIRLLAIVPALLLTCLFFLDQNISVRVVNSPMHNLKKGPGYHLDMLCLSLTTFVCSLFGLPWMCAGTVQSLAHVRALANIRPPSTTEDSINAGSNGSSNSGGNSEKFLSVQENRLTPFFVHAAIFGSLFLLPVLQKIPMSVISGLFLYLGIRMMSGNDFLARIRFLFMDPKMYPADSPMKKTSPWQVHAFTMVQVVCLSLLWILKLNKRTSMFFPSVIATLMFIRSKIAPKFFPEKTLAVLDSELEQPVTEGDDVPVDDPLLNPKLSAAN